MLRKMFFGKAGLAKKALSVLLSVLMIQFQVNWVWAQGVPGANTATTPPVLSATSGYQATAIAKIEAEIAEAQAELDANNAEIAENNEKIAENKEKLKEENLTPADETQAMTDMFGAIEDMESQMEANNATIAKNDQKMADNNAKIAENDREIEENSAAIQALDADIKSYQSDIDATDRAIAANDAEIAANNAKIAENDRKIAENSTAIKDCDSSINSMQAQLNANNADIASTDSQIAANNAKIAANDRSMAANNSTYQSNLNTINACDAAIAYNNSQINANNAQINANNARIAANDARMASDNAFVNQCNANIASCNAQVQSNKDKIHKLEKKIKDCKWYQVGKMAALALEIAGLEIANAALAVAKAANVAARDVTIGAMSLFNGENWNLRMANIGLAASNAGWGLANAWESTKRAAAVAANGVILGVISFFNTENFNLRMANIGLGLKNAGLVLANTGISIAISAVQATKAVILGVLSFFNAENFNLRMANIGKSLENAGLSLKNAGLNILKGAAQAARAIVLGVLSFFNEENFNLRMENIGLWFANAGLVLANAGIAIAIGAVKLSCVVVYAVTSLFTVEADTLQLRNEKLAEKNSKLEKKNASLRSYIAEANARKAALEAVTPISMAIAAAKMGFQVIMNSIHGFTAEGMHAEKGFAKTKYVYKDGKRTSGVTYKTDAQGNQILLTVYSFDEKGRIKQITDLTSGKHIDYGEIACSDGTTKWLAKSEYDGTGKLIGEYNYNSDGKLASKNVYGITAEEYKTSTGSDAPISKVKSTNGYNMLLTETVFYDSNQKPEHKAAYFLFVPKTEAEKKSLPGDSKMWKSISQVEALVGAVEKDASGGMVVEKYTYQWNEDKRDYVFKESVSFSVESYEESYKNESEMDTCNNTKTETGVETKWRIKSETTLYDANGNAHFIFDDRGAKVGEYNYLGGLLTSLTQTDRSSTYDEESGETLYKDMSTVIVFDNFGRVESVNVSGTIDVLIDMNNGKGVVDELDAIQKCTMTINENYTYKYNDTGTIVNDTVNDISADGTVTTKNVTIPPGGLLSVQRTSHSYGIVQFEAKIGCLDKEITNKINEKSQTTEYYDMGKMVSVNVEKLDLTAADLAVKVKIGGSETEVGKPATSLAIPKDQEWQVGVKILGIALEITGWIATAVLAIVGIVLTVLGVTAPIGVVVGGIAAGLASLVGGVLHSIFETPKISAPNIDPPSDFNPANPGYSAVSLMPPVDPPMEGPVMMAPIMPRF